MYKPVIILLFCVLFGCSQVPFFRESFSVSGDLANYPNQICTLTVAENIQGFGEVIGHKSISGVFNEFFMVPAQSREYRVIVTCDNQQIHYQVVMYPGTMGNGGTVALGVLL